MSLGDLTKQLAVQALAGPDKPKATESVAGESTGATLLGQLQAMQRALKDDEELVVLYRSGNETIVVREIYLPSWQVAVLGGVDPNKSTARVVAAVESLQLVCKVARVPAGSKAHRVGLIPPRPKQE